MTDPEPLILVADDDPILRELFALNLTMAGNRVRVAVDGQVALAEIARERPAVIVLDLMMPRCDGATVLRMLRANPAYEDLPVIVVTAKPGEIAMWDGYQAGADFYLRKPVRMEAIVELVAAIVEPGRETADVPWRTVAHKAERQHGDCYARAGGARSHAGALP